MKWEVKHRRGWILDHPSLFVFVSRILEDPLCLSSGSWLQLYPHKSFNSGMPTGRQETNMAIIHCIPVHTPRALQTSPLEGFAYFLSPSGRFATFTPRLSRLWPVTTWHVETCVTWGRGKGGDSSSRGLVMGWTWGKEAPIGCHVIRRSSLKDAVEEVLQISRVGWTCSVLWRGPESRCWRVQKLCVLETCIKVL